jgi:hypothetical protein
MGLQLLEALWTAIGLGFICTTVEDSESDTRLPHSDRHSVSMMSPWPWVVVMLQWWLIMMCLHDM